MKPKKEYVKPEIASIDSSEILAALGPASANGGMSPFTGSGCEGRHNWRPFFFIRAWEISIL